MADISENNKYQSDTQTPQYPLDQTGIRDLIKYETQKLKEEIKKQQDDLKDSKKDLVTVLGLFATFLTFTSVEFQLIKNLSSLSAFISLSLLMISLAIILVTVIKHDFSNKKEHLIKNDALILGGILLGLSILFFSFSIKEKVIAKNISIPNSSVYELRIN